MIEEYPTGMVHQLRVISLGEPAMAIDWVGEMVRGAISIGANACWEPFSASVTLVAYITITFEAAFT